MPRYTYHCEVCDSTMEVFHLMKERLEMCEMCGSDEVKKIPSQLAPKIHREKKTGDEVKQGIKKNKEILEQQKKDSRKDYV